MGFKVRPFISNLFLISLTIIIIFYFLMTFNLGGVIYITIGLLLLGLIIAAISLVGLIKTKDNSNSYKVNVLITGIVGLTLFIVFILIIYTFTKLSYPHLNLPLEDVMDVILRESQRILTT